MAETARYVYAVTRELSPESASGATGVGGAPVELVRHRGLTALVSTVSLAEFGEEPLRRNLEELVWLERTARAHDEVVRLAADHGPTAPLRMLTICTDDAAVHARLDEMYDDITAAITRVEGRHEWSVKLVLPPQDAPERPRRTSPPPPTGGGAAYLRAKKAVAQERREGEDVAVRAAQQVYDALSRVAVAARRLRPQDPRLTGIPGSMILNAAYLVDDAASESFTAAVAEQAEQHPQTQLRVDGPWPPYSFAMTEAP
jgi:hypothetical protein